MQSSFRPGCKHGPVKHLSPHPLTKRFNIGLALTTCDEVVKLLSNGGGKGLRVDPGSGGAGEQGLKWMVGMETSPDAMQIYATCEGP